MIKTKFKNDLCFKRVKDLEHNQDYSFYFHTNIVGVVLVDQMQYHYAMWKDFKKLNVPSNVLKHLIDDLQLLHDAVKYQNEREALAKLLKKTKEHKAYKPELWLEKPVA